MNNLSPLDGRYIKYVEQLKNYFSEKSLIRERLNIEIDYFIFLLTLNTPIFPYLESVKTFILSFKNLNKQTEYINDIKLIEKKINHDVKAIEIFLANKLKKNNFEQYVNLLHFGLTSQDITTTAYSINLKNFHENILLKEINNITNNLKFLKKQWENIIIIGRTHGQYATWTKLGKEINVFITRLKKDINMLKNFKFSTKFGGAIGNLTSHRLLINSNWNILLDFFINDNYNLEREKCTTQIHNYNNYSEYFDCIKRICSTLVDFCVDIWLYCSFEELYLEKPKEHVGSSIMPHKVNPIEFENAEGNFKICTMWCEFMSRELLKSRLQRDLTDSTLLRNVGVLFGHFILAIKKTNIGIKYLRVNKKVINKRLNDNLNSMSEIDQHLLRIENKVEGYNSRKNDNSLVKDINFYKQFL